MNPKMGKLLVIEDDFSLRDLLRVHLGALGHHVRVAADAAEAIHTIFDQMPDLVLLDINMPYLNGFELLEALRGDELTQAVPVIVLTARSDDDSYARAMHLGAKRYITKPVQLDELISAINSTL
jgi:DNA-binding response OmpR family regulator